MLNVQLIFKGGATTTVKVKKMTTTKSLTDGGYSKVEWTSMDKIYPKLHTLDVEQLTAVIILSDDGKD